MGARERPLAGVGVLVTRPAGQAEHLVRLIEAAGGNAIRFPTIAIAPPADPTTLAALFDRLTAFDFAIFISPNAVERALQQLRQRGQTLPAALRVACVGGGSAAALKTHGIDALAPAERFDSEGLLALPALQQVAGRRVVIFRGDGGRELLGNTLRARGAIVEYGECYRRVRPAADTAPLLRRWARGDVAVVSITSVTALNNLYEMLGDTGRQPLRETPIAVLSEAQAAACRKLGFVHAPWVARQATDEALVQTIVSWAATRGG